MGSVIGGVFAAFGLSASAGLNAYIPILIVALVAKFTPLIKLADPWSALTSWWIIGLLIVLSTIEFFADKFPAVNHVNDIIQSFVRPTAGAILFAASAKALTEIHPILSIAAGILVAGSVNAVKSFVVRPAVTATTAGAANTPVSILEDMTATAVSALSILLPVLVVIILVILAIIIIWWLIARSRKNQAVTG
jgi:hypothetical protein